MEETTTAVRSSPASPSGSESSPGALDPWESSTNLTGKGLRKYLRSPVQYFRLPSGNYASFRFLFGLVICCHGCAEWQ